MQDTSSQRQEVLPYLCTAYNMSELETIGEGLRLHVDKVSSQNKLIDLVFDLLRELKEGPNCVGGGASIKSAQ